MPTFPLAIDDFFRVGNYAEAGLWVFVAAVFGMFALKRSGSIRHRCTLATTVFFLFGMSDVVEVQTGAWWRPWWLLAWKAACVLMMVWLLVAHLRWQRKAKEHGDGTEHV